MKKILLLIFLLALSFLLIGCPDDGRDGPMGPSGIVGDKGDKGDTGLSAKEVEEEEFARLQPLVEDCRDKNAFFNFDTEECGCAPDFTEWNDGETECVSINQ